MAKLLSGTRIYGTTTVDTSVSIGTSNNTTGTGGILANTNTVFIGNNTTNVFLNTVGLNINAITIANTTGVYTGTVNAASHTVGASVVANAGGVYVTGVINAAVHSVGTVFTANATLVNAAAINITGQVNTATLFVTTSANIASSNVIANTAGVFVANATGVVNAAIHQTGGTGTGTGGIIANTTTLFIGNNTINTAITSTTLSMNGTLVANSTGANNAFNLGGVAAASYARLASPTFTGTVTTANVSTTGRLSVSQSGYTPSNANVVNSAIYTSGGYGGGITLNDTGIGSIWMQNAGTIMGLGVGTTAGVSGSLYLTAANVGINNTAPTNTLSVNGTTFLGGSATFSSFHTIDSAGGQFRTGSGNYGVRVYGGGGSDTTAGIIQFTNNPVSAQWGSIFANASYMGVGSDVATLYLRGSATVSANVTSTGVGITSLGVGTAHSGTAGEIRATNNITAYYSDGRLKDIIGKIENALDKINLLSGVVYKNNDVAAKYGYTNSEEQVGVIAQEVEQVLPQIVKPAPFDIGQNENGEYSLSGENYKTVQYEKLIPLLIEAIKELSEKVEKLENQK